MADRVYPSVIAAARLLFRVQGLRFRVEGAENVPRTGGAVMAINHIGYMDFTYAGFAALPAGRLVRFMAKQDVFTHPVSGPLMRGMHHIPVDRTAGAASPRASVVVGSQGPEPGLERAFGPLRSDASRPSPDPLPALRQPRRSTGRSVTVEVIKLFASAWLPIPGFVTANSLDDFVGSGEKGWWDSEAERRCGFHVDD